MPKRIIYIPCTPAGSLLYDLQASTKKKAIKKLLKAAWHMPYNSWENFKTRGYTIERIKKEY